MKRIHIGYIILDKRSKARYTVTQIDETEKPFQVITEVKDLGTGEEVKVWWTGPEIDLSFRIIRNTRLARAYLAPDKGVY
jgi:hypothetical protein